MNYKIEIEAKPAQNNDVCFFTLSVPLLRDHKAECHTKLETTNSPLFGALFDQTWVMNVAAEGNTLVIRKRNAEDWQEDAKVVAGIIRKLHAEGTPFFDEVYLEALGEKTTQAISETNQHLKVNDINIKSPLGLRIQKILSEVVGPSLASHGGHVNLIDVQNGKVYLHFGGGCQGCSQASVTVKQGIEKLLLKEFPELIGVEDITNHSLGKNPFFK
jgi:Fe/S biogenesis protein NfuA